LYHERFLIYRKNIIIETCEGKKDIDLNLSLILILIKKVNNFGKRKLVLATTR